MLRKGMLLLLLLLALPGCTSNQSEEVIEEETGYQSDYAKNFDFQGALSIINTVYYEYHDVFSGIYLVEGEYHINVTSDAPEELISLLSNSSVVTHHIVAYSFGELWTVREIITSRIINDEGSFQGIGISESENKIIVSYLTDTIVPDDILRYEEIGMVRIEFQDVIPVFT